MITNGIVTYLNSLSSITSLAGNRIQPIPAPEDLSQYPCITYQTTSAKREYANDGAVGITESRIIFNCLAARYIDAQTLALAIASAFSGYTGTLPDGTIVFLAEVVNVMDGYIDNSRISSTQVHIWFQYQQ